MVNRIPVKKICLLFAHRSTGNTWDIQDIVLPQKLARPLKNSGLSRLPSFRNGPFSTAGHFFFLGCTVLFVQLNPESRLDFSKHDLRRAACGTVRCLLEKMIRFAREEGR